MYLPPDCWSVLLLHNFGRSDVLEIYDDPEFEKYNTPWKGMLKVAVGETVQCWYEWEDAETIEQLVYRGPLVR